MSDYQPMNQPPPVDPVGELAKFLRTNGSTIEDKTFKLSLSTASLVYLNKRFHHLTQNQAAGSSTSAQTKRKQDLTYLLQFFQRTHAIKLVHGTVTLQGAVDIGQFRALTFLEIKRVPVHLLVGLKALRRQLEILICSRSLTSISTLLQSCGGDMSSEAPWPSLLTLNLSHNHLDKLDDSLKLLPSLKTLDLSHNDIKHTRSYLEDLSEITHLNLSFNQMETIPALGLVARTNLKSLSLKSNNLESLAGLDEYTRLEVLDVATNCICDKLELRMLGYLRNLKAVYLRGNPLAYDPDYRLLVVRNLPSAARRNKTQIDGTALTPKELELISQETLTPSPIARRKPPKESNNALENSINVNADISSFEDSMDLSSSKPLIQREKKSKRAMRRVKHAAIADPTKAHLDTNTPITTSDSDIEGTKQKMESMRKHHGSDWLLALQEPYQTPAIRTEPSQDASATKTEQPVVVEVHREDSLTETQPKEQEMVIVERSVDTEKPSEPEAEDQPVKTIDSKTTIYPIKLSESDEVVQEEDTKATEEALELLSPLLVTVHSKDDSEQIQLFVTVKSSHIEERDILGNVTEELELVSLKGMKKTQDTMRDSESQEFRVVPVVELTFDYIRRDRQKRRYFMENEDSCVALVSILEPFVERSQALARQKGMVQCLKCSAEFHRQDAKRKVHKKQRKSTNHKATRSQDSNSSSDIESMNEVLVCPECSSGMLVDLEHPQHINDLTSSLSTPIGSLSSVELNVKPIATSSPWKPLDKDSTLSSPSTDYHSAEGSPLSSPHQPSQQKAKSITEISTTTGDTQIYVSSDKTPTASAINSELSTSHPKRSLVGDFNLPDATMRMSVGESAGEEISPYPPEKLSQMLYTGVKGFDQKYSLVPPGLCSGTSSNEASRPSSPRSRGSDADIGRKSRTMSVDSSEDSQQTSNGVAVSKDGMLSGRDPQFPTQSNFGCVRPSEDQSSDSKLNTRNRMQSGTLSEDDFEVLDKHDLHTLSNSSNLDCQSGGHRGQSRGHTGAKRLGSNDSDIAIIGDQTDDSLSKPDITVPDTVFDSEHGMQTNLASALSDVDSRLQDLSPVPELSSNVSGQETSSSSDSDLHVHGNSPNAHLSFHSNNTEKIPSEQQKISDSPLEHSFTESQISDSIYSRTNRRKSSPFENNDLDFSQVDHRLKLHFDMTLFGDEEEFQCMIKATIYQLSKSVDFKGYLLVSTHNLFILKINKEESDSPDDFLRKRTQHPIRDLLFIHIGLGSQSFQLEFNNDGILYTVAVRDKQGCEKFVSQLTDVVHNSPSSKRKYRGIVRDHPNTLANLMCQVFGAHISEDTSEVDTNLTLYLLGYRKVVKEMKRKQADSIARNSGMALQLEPVGIAATASDIYLIQENHLWPLQQAKGSRGSARSQSSQQFKHHDQHAITDISGLELYEDAPCDITINFSVEDTGEDIQWHIQTETVSSLAALMSAIQSPWQQLFGGVSMPQIMHPTITLQDDF